MFGRGREPLFLKWDSYFVFAARICLSPTESPSQLILREGAAKEESVPLALLNVGGGGISVSGFGVGCAIG